MGKQISIFITVFLLVCGTAIFTIYKKKKEIEMNTKENIDSLENSISYKTLDTTNSQHWFPVPIVSKEKVNTRNGKYVFTLENGFTFYTNENYDLKDTICWMNEAGDLKFKNGEIINGSDLY